MARRTAQQNDAQHAALQLLLPGGADDRNPEGVHADHSHAFTLAGTETVAAQKELIDDALDRNPASMPRLVRFKSYSNPYVAVIKCGFGKSVEVAKYEVPGGSLANLCPGSIEVVCYGKIETKAFALFSRAVTGASVEILPGLGHVPARPPQSDRLTVVPNDDEAPGDWTVMGPLSSGWPPAGRTRLDIFATGAVEFGWFDNTSPTQVLVGSFVVANVLLDLRHTGALQLQARHPGGAAITDSRTCTAIWSRTS